MGLTSLYDLAVYGILNITNQLSRVVSSLDLYTNVQKVITILSHPRSMYGYM